MDSVLKNELIDMGIDYTYSESSMFKALIVDSKIAVRTVKSLLYVLAYTVVFVQPIGNKFEILFN